MVRGDTNQGEKLTVKNTGNRYGAEVVQLYTSQPVCSVLRPEKELKAFEKVFLQPGESKTVEMNIKVSDLAFYDEAKKCGMLKQASLYCSPVIHQGIFCKK